MSKPVKIYIDCDFQLGNRCFTSLVDGILIPAGLLLVMVEWHDNYSRQLNYCNHYLPLALSPSGAMDGKISSHQQREN